MATSAINFVNVHKFFDNKTVLDGIDYALHEQQSLVVLGRSGCGKSVMLKCLLGLLNPNTGEVYVDNKVVQKETRAEREERFKNTGVAFQSSALFDSMSIWENIAFKLIYGMRMPLKKAKELAYEQLSVVGLSESVGALYPAEISGGMQRRASLARAIITKPKYLFFDEVTAGLDPIFSKLVSNIIRDILQTMKATSITITHDIESAKIIGSGGGAIILNNGRIAWSGDVAELATSDSPVVRQFVDGKIDGPIKLD